MLRSRAYLAAMAACFGSVAACSSDDNALMRSGGVVATGGGGGGTGGGAPIACVNTTQCPSPLVCNDLGECVACTADVECASTQRCIGNACRNPCVSDRECVPPICDRTIGFCVDCRKDADCAAGVACSQGRCGGTVSATGGSGATGGSNSGGAAKGGTGGTPDGGTGGTGLSGSGGSPTGGAPTGGVPTGGVPATGGRATGGVPATGGRATGGFGTGGRPPTTCGNDIIEPGEGCEDGNREFADGCSPSCKKEPYCTLLGCLSTCGDGLLVTSAGEECDDGNLTNGDGCSSSCLIEPGYDCTQPAAPSTVVLPMVLRDFDANGEDFEPAISGSDSAVTGIVQTTLVDRRPAFSGTNSQQPTVAFDTLFPDWYRPTARNATVVGELTLYSNGQGGYVNRWGPNGERWTAVTYNNVRWCSNTALHDRCAACSPRPAAGETCYDSGCTPWGNQQECVATVVTSRQDGSPAFFPVDGQGLAPSCQGTDSAVANPTAPCAQARIPPAYMNGDPNWLLEPGGAYHNFSFTSEVRFWFLYDSARTYQLDFQGDDDVWVFVNRRLALDLGGIHTPASGSVQLPRDAATLGLTSGTVYEVAIFQAERQTTGSTYKLTLTGFDFASTQCTLR